MVEVNSDVSVRMEDTLIQLTYSPIPHADDPQVTGNRDQFSLASLKAITGNVKNTLNLIGAYRYLEETWKKKMTSINAFPDEIRVSPSLASFRKQLQIYLYTKAYQP